MKHSDTTLKIGVSACLLGDKVRYDGGHKQDYYLTNIMGQYLELVPFCPEFDTGMGVPREAVCLMGSPDSPCMIGMETGTDWTARMNKSAQRRVKQLKKETLSGYILKKDSPSCGIERVKVFADSGARPRHGRGLFAATLIDRLPLLPVIDEEQLYNTRLRENFIVRIFTYHRLQRLLASRISRGTLKRFHKSHKYLLLAHSQKHYRLMSQLLTNVKPDTTSTIRNKYKVLFMEAFKFKTTIRINVTVLQHILRVLKNQITCAEKQDITMVIDDYRKQAVPLLVPITLLKHCIIKYNIEHLQDQVYLNPQPMELMLRYHV